jgi:hypothetical protein
MSQGFIVLPKDESSAVIMSQHESGLLFSLKMSHPQLL